MLEDGFTELNLDDNSENILNESLDSESCLRTSFTPERNVAHEVLPTDTSKGTSVNTISGDAFVKITSPAKVGEGISSYICNGKDFSVFRRFSDFLGLHERLVSKYLSEGVIVPPVPSKDMLATTKVKISKDVSAENEFVERRRIALERFLSRVLAHPVLRVDEDVCEFLQHDGELPRSTNTQLLSGAAAIKVMKNLGDAIGKLAYKVDDPEEFFYQKADELDIWEKQLKRLHSSLLNLVSGDNDLANAEAGLSRSILLLANVEENTGLAQALHHLAETEGHIADLHALQADALTCHLVEYSREILGMVQACKDVLSERVRIYRTWRTAESNLRSKREQKIRMEMSGRSDHKKMAMITMELEDLENRVDQAQHKFNNISENTKREFQNFDFNRFAYFKQATTEYLELLLQIQLKVSKYHSLWLVRKRDTEDRFVINLCIYANPKKFVLEIHKYLTDKRLVI
ncbi:Sorting nexin-2 [Schistosoma japonicum]|nr:Sorting nexin-2 [Schistosoma japonicum]